MEFHAICSISEIMKTWNEIFLIINPWQHLYCMVYVRLPNSSIDRFFGRIPQKYIHRECRYTHERTLDTESTVSDEVCVIIPDYVKVESTGIIADVAMHEWSFLRINECVSRSRVELSVPQLIFHVICQLLTCDATVIMSNANQ